MADESLNSVISRLRDIYGDGAGKSKFVLVDIGVENQLDFFRMLMEFLVGKEHLSVIYITTGRTSADLLDKLPKDFDASGIFFVDAVSRIFGLTSDSEKNSVFVSGPINLDEILKAVQSRISAVKPRTPFLVLDSATTILLYNSVQRTKSFIGSLVKQLKKSHANLVIQSLARGQSNQQLLDELSKLVDESISTGEKQA